MSVHQPDRPNEDVLLRRPPMYTRGPTSHPWFSRSSRGTSGQGSATLRVGVPPTGPRPFTLPVLGSSVRSTTISSSPRRVREWHVCVGLAGDPLTSRLAH